MVEEKEAEQAANDRITQLETENDSMRADLLLWRESK
jgi:hypothetical protein